MFQGPRFLLRLLRTEDVQKEIELIDEQKEELQALSQRRPGDRRERPNWRDLSDQQRRERREEMRKEGEKRAAELEKKLKEILLPNQLERLHQIRLQVVGIFALDDPKVQKELGITEEQKEKMKALHEESRTKFRETWEVARDLSPEERQERRDEMRKKMEELQKELSEKLTAVLTTEQKGKFEEMKGEKFELDRSQLFRPPRRGQNSERRGGRRAEGNTE